MFGDGSDLKYHIFKDYNVVFDEKGSTTGSLRLVQWHKADSEPNLEKAKLEIRKLYINAEGERVAKGYSFSTEDGPHELVKGMIESGFGKTKDILKALRKRDDFVESVKNINKDEDDEYSGEMFDMRDLMLSDEFIGDEKDA